MLKLLSFFEADLELPFAFLPIALANCSAEMATSYSNEVEIFGSWIAYVGEFLEKKLETLILSEGKCYFASLLSNNIPCLASQCSLG